MERVSTRLRCFLSSWLLKQTLCRLLGPCLTNYNNQTEAEICEPITQSRVPGTSHLPSRFDLGQIDVQKQHPLLLLQRGLNFAELQNRPATFIRQSKRGAIVQAVPGLAEHRYSVGNSGTVLAVLPKEPLQATTDRAAVRVLAMINEKVNGWLR